MRALTISPLVASPLLMGAGVVALAATVDGDDGQTFCVFRLCTGGYCPGCGGGRAMLALVRGDLGGSWALHPWVLVLAAQLILALVLAVRFSVERLSVAVVPVLLANLVFGVALWAVRLATGSIPLPFG